MMSWKQLTAVTEQVNTERISDLFSNLGAESVTFQDAAGQPLYEPKPGEIKTWDSTEVIGLFDKATDIEAIQNIVSEQLPVNTVSRWEHQILEDQAWERTWLNHFKPMRFGERLWVCPTGEKPPNPQDTCITLDPGLAFGTGTHPTTALCLEWLDSHEIQNKIVVDYGCGSGVLGIAALLLGAKKVYAVDIDPQALIATADNAKKNSVQDKIHCRLPKELPTPQADVLLANILANPLIELSATIAERVRNNGRIVLSGILPDQTDSVVNAYHPFFELDPVVIQEEWVRISGKKTETQ